MKTERRVLEAVGWIGLIGVVVFIVNGIYSLGSPTTGFEVVIRWGAVAAMALGAAAGLGLLVAERVSLRQERIIAMLKEVLAAQDELKRSQTELAAKVASMPELPQA